MFIKASGLPGNLPAVRPIRDAAHGTQHSPGSFLSSDSSVATETAAEFFADMATEAAAEFFAEFFADLSQGFHQFIGRSRSIGAGREAGAHVPRGRAINARVSSKSMKHEYKN